ncbi:hypothetical protein QTO34_010137 [Cnephaeus nilssonii]|uniref:Golgi-associated olfactory signaling regulator n=1 Tax=Cnephaeus nilssonii TaxID=3371016 RepID=A0AA40LFQ8_CNENI|nr:hypothetical protein QTO34_010137 [Eptesicus nilssonii]
MAAFGPLLFLVCLLAGRGSTAAPSAAPTAGSDSPGRASPRSPLSLLRKTPLSASLTQNPRGQRLRGPPRRLIRSSPHNFTDTPTPDLQEPPHPESPEASKPNSLNTSTSEAPETPKINPSQMTHPEPSETPTPTCLRFHTPKFPGTLNPDPPQTPHQEFPGIPELNSTEISQAEAPDPDPTKPFTSKLQKSMTPTPLRPQTLNSSTPTLLIPPTQNPIPYPDAAEIARDSDPETSTRLHPDTPAPSRDQAPALHGLPLNPEPEPPAATQPNSLKLPTSEFPGTAEPKASQNSSPKGPEAALSSSRIADPPAPPGPPNQPAPATLRAPQRRSRGERVNTIILVERVKETGVTLVGRPRGGAGGALCLFFAGTGLLIGIFLLLWCLYRRAARHRPFAHHRLPNDGEESVLHLDAPKEPYDLYFYAPDAWIPSHISTKQPPPTPPLPPKLPPPPRGGRSQRLEPLSPATLPDNFV